MPTRNSTQRGRAVRDHTHRHQSVALRTSHLIVSLILHQLTFINGVSAFIVAPSILRLSFSTFQSPSRCAAKGFGSASSSSKPTITKKSALKRVKKKYGGISSKEIAAGTQHSIERAMEKLPHHLVVATTLYQQLRKWDASLAKMSILQQASIPEPELQGAKRAKLELDQIYQEHDLSDDDVHNIFQMLTWDASADAKTARAITGAMPADIATRINKAVSILVDAAGDKGRCLDIGCGFGAVVPNFLEQGLKPSQFFGVDISPQMIRNGKELYPDCAFTAADLSMYDDPDGFDGILFCSALHDMPDPMGALEKAAHLLRTNGKVVIVHAQGALHVNKQVDANPILVKRGLPTKDELDVVAQKCGLSLLIEPAKAGTPKDVDDGYLAVLQRNDDLTRISAS